MRKKPDSYVQAKARNALRLIDRAISVNRNHYDLDRGFFELRAKLLPLALENSSAIKLFTDADTAYLLKRKQDAFVIPQPVREWLSSKKIRWNLATRPELAVVHITSNGGRKAGTFIAPGGWILTCAHGFPDQGIFHADFFCRTPLGTLMAADAPFTVHWLDHLTDLAIGQIEGHLAGVKAHFDHYVLPLDDHRLKIGEEIVCIGHPGKDDTGETPSDFRTMLYSQVQGIILDAQSSDTGMMHNDDRVLRSFKTTAYVRGGFSGGPVVRKGNANAMVVGMPFGGAEKPEDTGEVIDGAAIAAQVRSPKSEASASKRTPLISFEELLNDKTRSTLNLGAGTYRIMKSVVIQGAGTLRIEGSSAWESRILLGEGVTITTERPLEIANVTFVTEAGDMPIFHQRHSAQIRVANAILIGVGPIAVLMVDSQMSFLGCFILSFSNCIESFSLNSDIAISTSLTTSLMGSCVLNIGGTTKVTTEGEWWHNMATAFSDLFLQLNGTFVAEAGMYIQRNAHYGVFGSSAIHDLGEIKRVAIHQPSGSLPIIMARDEFTYSVATFHKGPSLNDDIRVAKTIQDKRSINTAPEDAGAAVPTGDCEQFVCRSGSAVAHFDSFPKAVQWSRWRPNVTIELPERTTIDEEVIFTDCYLTLRRQNSDSDNSPQRSWIELRKGFRVRRGVVTIIHCILSGKDSAQPVIAVYGGTVKMSEVHIVGGRGIRASEKGRVEMNGGSVSASQGDGIYVSDRARITVAGTSIHSNVGCGIKGLQGARLTIKMLRQGDVSIPCYIDNNGEHGVLLAAPCQVRYWSVSNNSGEKD